MKKITKIIFIIFTNLFLFVSFSCIDTIPEDYEVYNQFDPLEWSDDYVFAASNYPQSIKVWNSKTKELVKVYKFYKEKDEHEYMDIMQMAYLGKSLWFLGTRKEQNLIQFDIETGKLDYKKLGFCPSEICSIPKEVDGVGSVWAISYPLPNTPRSFACFDSSGEKIDEFKICNDNATDGELGISYIEGNYYILTGKNTRYNISGINNNVLSVINLSTKQVEGVNFDDFYNFSFIKNEFHVDDDFSFLGGVTIYDSENEKLVSASCISSLSNLGSRQLYRLNSIEPFDVTYLDIKWNFRRLSNIITNSNSIITVGRPIYADYDGLEAGFYSINGGAQQKYAKLPEGNQIFYQVKDGCTWLSVDKWRYLSGSETWDKTGPERIYMIEHNTENIYEFCEDGTSREIQYISGEADYIQFNN